MRWDEIRERYPNTWLVIEALQARSEQNQRLVDRMEVVELCPDGAGAFREYRRLQAVHPQRELYFVHTSNTVLAIEERIWLGLG
jgi:hypothetical protein